MRSGILIALVGAWLVLRTVREDATGRNLVDRILGAPSAAAGGSNVPAAPTPSRSPSVGPPAPSVGPPAVLPALPGRVPTVKPVGPLKPIAGPAGVIG